MYKEKITTAVTYFSSLIMATAFLFLPTMIVSRQKGIGSNVATQKTKKLQKSVSNSTEKPLKKLQASEDKGVKKETVNEIAILIYNNVPSQSGSDSKEFEKSPDIVLTRLDIERPSIDGRRRTVEELVMDQLMNSEAIYFYRMVVPEDAVDKYINSIKEQHHLSDEQLRGMFKEVGYTYEEGRQQLAMGQAIDSLLNFKIRSRLIVLEKDVRAYYDAHPAYEEASYRIKKNYR